MTPHPSSVLRITALVLCIASAILWVLAWGPLQAWTDPSDAYFFLQGFCFFRVPVPAPFADPLVIPLVVGCKPYTGRSASCFVNPLFVALTSALPLLVGRYIRKRRRLLLRRGMCPMCHYDLRGTPDRCPECGADRAAMLARVGGGTDAPASSRPNVILVSPTAISVAICAFAFVIWSLSFTRLKGDQRGLAQVFVADGNVWIGPLFPAEQQPIHSRGWNIGVASYTQSDGLSGTRWTSISINLWVFIILATMPGMIRRQKRGQEKKKGA